jgi:hypothetical protein
LLWMKWHSDMVLSEFSGFLPVSIIMPVLHIRLMGAFMFCSSPNIIRISLCQEALGSIPFRSFWDLSWMKWHSDMVLSEFSGFLPVSIVMPVLHTCSFACSTHAI